MKLTSRSLLLLAAGAFALVVGAFRASSLFAPAPAKRAEAMYERGGAVIAKLVHEATGGKGGVLLVEPERGLAGNAERARWLQMQIEGFEQALGGQPIVARTTVGAVASRMDALTNRMATFTTEACSRLAKQHPEAAALVSFVGAPAGPVAAGLPPMVCFAPQGTGVEAWMKAGVLKAAVVPRVSPVPMSEASGDWFDTMYEVVTPATVAAWSHAFASPARR